MFDMLVKLYDLKEEPGLSQRMKEEGVRVKRAMAFDRNRVLQFVAEQFGEGWACECANALAENPTNCFIAIKDKQVVGFACFDCTSKNFFGPMGVLPSMRAKRVGEALLKKCLWAMEAQGYGYAVIGGVSSARGFYEKTVGAAVIPGSETGVYHRLIDAED